MAELDCCGPSERAHIAHDVGVSNADLCVLAGKWPGSAELLLRRMEVSKLDAAVMTQVEPQVIRDLQRTCSFCMSKRKCTHDLAANRPIQRGRRTARTQRRSRIWSPSAPIPA